LRDAIEDFDLPTCFQAERKTVAIQDLLNDPRTHDNEFVLQEWSPAYLGRPDSLPPQDGKVIACNSLPLSYTSARENDAEN